jgi:phosphoribosylanthranilate isomerase
VFGGEIGAGRFSRAPSAGVSGFVAAEECFIRSAANDRAGLDNPPLSCDGGGMPPEVKICGLSDAESVAAALDAGADYVGFVFFPPSPRNVAPARAAELGASARGRARIVALTVDAEDALLDEIVRTLRPDLLQLHGKEPPGRVAAIRARTGVPVMKAIGVAAASDLAAASRYDADRILLDAKPPRNATRPGGNGAAFDWSLLRGFACARPWLLSGGLDPSNVAAALAATGASGVDVSSGVERAPGRKDPALIRAFVEAVRRADVSPRRMAG